MYPGPDPILIKFNLSLPAEHLDIGIPRLRDGIKSQSFVPFIQGRGMGRVWLRTS